MGEASARGYREVVWEEVIKYIFLIAALASCASCISANEANKEAMPVESNGGIGDGKTLPVLHLIDANDLSEWAINNYDCHFTANENERPIFQSRTDDSPEGYDEAVIKLNGNLYGLSMESFDIMDKKRTDYFIGESIFVDMISDQANAFKKPNGAIFWPATLKISDDRNGSTNSYQGTYQCKT